MRNGYGVFLEESFTMSAPSKKRTAPDLCLFREFYEHYVAEKSASFLYLTKPLNHVKDYAKLCRVCNCTDDGTFIDLDEEQYFEFEPSIRSYRMLFQQTSELMQFNPMPDLPKRICLRCAYKVKMAYCFIRQFIKTQNAMRFSITAWYRNNDPMKPEDPDDQRCIREQMKNQQNINKPILRQTKIKKETVIMAKPTAAVKDLVETCVVFSDQEDNFSGSNHCQIIGELDEVNNEPPEAIKDLIESDQEENFSDSNSSQNIGELAQVINNVHYTCQICFFKLRAIDFATHMTCINRIPKLGQICKKCQKRMNGSTPALNIPKQTFIPIEDSKAPLSSRTPKTPKTSSNKDQQTKASKSSRPSRASQIPSPKMTFKAQCTSLLKAQRTSRLKEVAPHMSEKNAVPPSSAQLALLQQERRRQWR